MQELFAAEFSRNDQKEKFTIFKVEENLFQARSNFEVIILWKINSRWEGAGNINPQELISEIGAAIDNFNKIMSQK